MKKRQTCPLCKLSILLEGTGLDLSTRSSLNSINRSSVMNRSKRYKLEKKRQKILLEKAKNEKDEILEQNLERKDFFQQKILSFKF